MLFSKKKKLQNVAEQAENKTQEAPQNVNISNSHSRIRYVKSIAKNLKKSQEIALYPCSQKPQAFLEKNFDNFVQVLDKQLGEHYSLDEIKRLCKIVDNHCSFVTTEHEKHFGNGATLPFYSQIVLKKELVKEYDGIRLKSVPFNRDSTTCSEYYPFNENEKYKLFKYTYLDFDKDEEGNSLPSSTVMREKVSYALANEKDFLIASCTENGLKNKYFAMNNFANIHPENYYHRIEVYFNRDFGRNIYLASYAKVDDIFMECLDKTYNSYRNSAEKMVLSKDSNIAVKVWDFKPLESKKDNVLFDILQSERCEVHNELDCHTLKFSKPCVIKVDVDNEHYDEFTYGQGEIEIKQEDIKSFPRYASTFIVGSKELTPNDFVDSYDYDKTFSLKDKLRYNVDIYSQFIYGKDVKCKLEVTGLVLAKASYDLNGDVLDKEYYDFNGRKLGALTQEKNKVEENCL